MKYSFDVLKSYVPELKRLPLRRGVQKFWPTGVEY